MLGTFDDVLQFKFSLFIEVFLFGYYPLLNLVTSFRGGGIAGEDPYNARREKN